MLFIPVPTFLLVAFCLSLLKQVRVGQLKSYGLSTGLVHVKTTTVAYFLCMCSSLLG